MIPDTMQACPGMSATHLSVRDQPATQGATAMLDRSRAVMILSLCSYVTSDLSTIAILFKCVSAVKSKVSYPPSSAEFSPPIVTSLRVYRCLSTEDDITALKANLAVLESRRTSLSPYRHFSASSCLSRPDFPTHKRAQERAEGKLQRQKATEAFIT